jgi:hypothetical protein
MDKCTAKSYSSLVACLTSGPVTWASHLQSVVALSSTEAKLIALVEAIHQALYMCKLYDALNILLNKLTSIYCNNQSTIQIITKPPYAYHSHLKHMTIKEGFIYDNLKCSVVNVIYVPSNNNMANFLTKAVPAAKLHTNRAKLNVFLCG